MPNEENYSLFNPSIADYVLNEYGNDYESLVNIFKSLNTVKSLEQLVALERAKIISKKYISKLKNELFIDAFKNNKKIDYLVFISYLLIDDESKKATIIELIKKIINDPILIVEFSKFLSLFMKYDDDLDLNNFDFLLGCISNRYLDEYEIKNFAEFLELYDIIGENIVSRLITDVEYFITDELDSRKDDIDLSNFIEFSEGYEGEQEVYFDEKDIKQELIEIVSSIINDFYSVSISNLDINIQEIINTIDIDQMIEDFINSQEEPDLEGWGGSRNSFDQDIDDLFERS